MMRSNAAGFTLIEIVLATVITGIIVVATGQMLMSIQNQLKNSQASSSRVLSLYRLTDRITDRTAYAESFALSPLNDVLRACIQGGAAGGCATNCCISGTAAAPTVVEFALLDPRDSTKPDISQRRLILGTVAKPAYYTAEGESCFANTPGSFFKVTGTFTPRCPGGATSCDKAELIVLNLQVDPIAATSTVRSRNLTVHFSPNSNSPPTMQAIANQTVKVGEKIKFAVNGNSGHPQEKQDLLFNVCKPSDNRFAKVTCYGFINDIAYVIVEGLEVGDTNLNLIIQDTGFDNNLSQPLSIPLKVTPP